MIATAHQPVYMPWLGLIHKISVAEAFISWDAVQMEDSGYENRQRIRGGQWLTVPVHRGRDVPIKDVTIANEHHWQRKHYRAIKMAYERAPHWEEYAPVLRSIYDGSRKWERLVELNEFILGYLLEKFDIRPRMWKLSELETTTHKGEQVLEACTKIGADAYVFGAMGREYANTRMFRDANVEPLMQDYDPVPYDQGKGAAAFEARLWAFDALMYLDAAEAGRVMLAGGRLSRMET